MSVTYKTLLLLTALSVSIPCRADVWCTLTNFIVDAHDHGDAYVHGTLSGYGAATFVVLCGETNGAHDCTTQATDRRLATALAAQSGGHNLNLLFVGLTSCSQYQPYTRPASVQMLTRCSQVVFAL
jgi:purine nucleoside permease